MISVVWFFRHFFSDGWRYLEALFTVLRSNIFGVLGVVGYALSFHGIAFWQAYGLGSKI